MLPQINEKFSTPFHIYDGEGIRNTIRRMQRAFAENGVEHQQFFAVKALPNPKILDIMGEENCGFDCSSETELRLTRTAGATPKQIIFTSNNTSPAEFKEALGHGGCYLNLDDISFIDRIPSGMPDFVCFRLNPGSRKTSESNEIIGDPKQSKFGVPIEKIVQAFRLAKNAGATRFGLHAMVCSNDLDCLHMVHTVQILLEVALKLQTKLKINLEFLNMGGGIGIPYRPGEKEFNIEQLARECALLLQSFRGRSGYTPKLFTECGRYITGPHGVLVNGVLNDLRKYKRFVGVQAGMSALMRVGMYYDPKDAKKSAYHHFSLLDSQGQTKVGRRSRASVIGPNCENNDFLARDILLPKSDIGDLGLSHDSGAHCSAMTITYNGRTRVQELLMFDDNSIHRITRPETFEDLVSRYTGLFTDNDVLEP